MAKLTLIFQAGFDNDTLIVELNRRSQTVRGITTDYSSGVAGKLSLDTEPGENRLLVHSPKTGQGIDVEINGDEPNFVVVEQLPNGKLTAEAVAEEGPRF